MSKYLTKYPIGATWQKTDNRKRTGKIWLEARNGFFEVWRWSVVWEDGSGYESNWSTSYRKCKEEIPIYEESVRFTRVK